jgi:hypothetical protein
VLTNEETGRTVARFKGRVGEAKMVYRGKQRTMPEILIELREDDPEFKQAISAQGFRAGQTIAEPEALNLNLYTLMK